MTPFELQEPAPQGQVAPPGVPVGTGVGGGVAEGHVDWSMPKDLLVVPDVPSGYVQVMLNAPPAAAHAFTGADVAVPSFAPPVSIQEEA